MFKKEIYLKSKATYCCKDSKIGVSSPKNHPDVNIYRYFLINKRSIKVGDIVRCDGLLFMSRPQTIYGPWRKVFDKNGKLQSWERDVLYSPVKVGDGFWVLRKSV